jgi:hypothetical protein
MGHMGMRIATTIVAALGFSALASAGCGKEDSGADYARQQAAEADKERFKDAPKAVKVETPVPGGKHIACDKLIDAAAFGTAIGEKEPVTLADNTAGTADAAAVCGIVRGGKRPTEKEQAAMLKKSTKLGVMPGDQICRVAAFCWSAENEAKFKEKCPTTGGTMTDELGFQACVRLIATGAVDVKLYRFIDADTRCILEVGAGPSLSDNDLVASCARTAASLVGAEQIKSYQ